MTKLEHNIQGEGEHKFCTKKAVIVDLYNNYLKVLLIKPRDLIALEVALWNCSDGLRVLVDQIPKSFSSVVLSKAILSPSDSFIKV